MILSYLGSKATLLPYISRVIEPLIKPDTVFCDLFMGSGCVSNYFKSRVHSVIACDTELYSYVIGKALLTCPYSHKLAMIIDQINLQCDGGKKGLVHANFATGGRLYFTEENAMRIDYMRLAIDQLYSAKLVTYSEFLFLLGSLLTSASARANTCGTFRAHLKTVSVKAKKQIKIVAIHKDVSILNAKCNIVKNDDAIKCSSKCITANTIVYLDPPYNSVHYGAGYSFLNYLCLYDSSVTTVGTGTMLNYNKSKFGLQKHALAEFKSLFDAITCRYIVMSYSSEGILHINQIANALVYKGNVVIYKVWHKSYQTHNTGRNRLHVIEYIIVCDCDSVARKVTKTWLKL